MNERCSKEGRNWLSVRRTQLVRESRRVEQRALAHDWPIPIWEDRSTAHRDQTWSSDLARTHLAYKWADSPLRLLKLAAPSPPTRAPCIHNFPLYHDFRRCSSPDRCSDPHLGSLNRVLAPIRPVWPLEPTIKPCRDLPVHPSSYVILYTFFARIITNFFCITRPHNGGY